MRWSVSPCRWRWDGRNRCRMWIRASGICQPWQEVAVLAIPGQGGGGTDRGEKMLLIKMDLNCWFGDNIIPGNPTITASSNGRMFQNFLKRHKDIHLVNSMSICGGIITWQRVTQILNEKSSNNVFVVVWENIALCQTNVHQCKQGKSYVKFQHIFQDPENY